MNAIQDPGATVTSVLAPYTMDELLEWRMEARAAGRNTLADTLSREIKRRVDESDAARYHKA
ncbi:MAG TPA: hypothetical protein VL027_01875 [Spongiibacteraceae bacterium]|nr:hypothetical protein [Spongiibacteraceae bacterium]